MTKPLVIYHADCTDGYGAAFAAWLKLGDEAEYLPMQYGDERTKPVVYADREVYILDFSFPRPVIEYIFGHASRIVWLDHHASAFEMWCGKYERGMFWPEETTDERRYIRLDDNKSGAMLAWEYFHPGTEIPLLIQHIDDRDRWQFKLEGSKELHAALSSLKPWSFEQWRDLFMLEDHHGDGPFFIDEKCRVMRISGAAILRAQDAAVAQAVKHARRVYVPCELSSPHFLDSTANGLAVSCPLHQSEIGHELANKSGTFGLIWYMKEDGSIICSLRSNGDYDVSAIANAFGGGGHKNAAGFQTDMQTLMGWLK